MILHPREIATSKSHKPREGGSLGLCNRPPFIPRTCPRHFSVGSKGLWMAGSYSPLLRDAPAQGKCRWFQCCSSDEWKPGGRSGSAPLPPGQFLRFQPLTLILPGPPPQRLPSTQDQPSPDVSFPNPSANLSPFPYWPRLEIVDPVQEVDGR